MAFVWKRNKNEYIPEKSKQILAMTFPQDGFTIALESTPTTQSVDPSILRLYFFVLWIYEESRDSHVGVGVAFSDSAGFSLFVYPSDRFKKSNSQADWGSSRLTIFWRLNCH